MTSIFIKKTALLNLDFLAFIDKLLSPLLYFPHRKCTFLVFSQGSIFFLLLPNSCTFFVFFHKAFIYFLIEPTPPFFNLMLFVQRAKNPYFEINSDSNHLATSFMSTACLLKTEF